MSPKDLPPNRSWRPAKGGRTAGGQAHWCPFDRPVVHLQVQPGRTVAAFCRLCVDVDTLVKRAYA